jgi:hypothetical protein
MEWERYEQFQVSDDVLEFTFNSVGPKGIITMIVQFKQTNDPEIYNLASGIFFRMVKWMINPKTITRTGIRY